MVRMDTLEKQRSRQQCPGLWRDAQYQTVEVCWICGLILSFER